jgi:DNA sulfur modification protein DndD
MIIKKIKIVNFRQYKGSNEIDTDTNKDQNINIIIGSTGYGKTNFSNAIQWCLYGEDIVGSDSMGLLNMNVFDNLNEGQSEEVRVEILLQTDKKELYTVSRSVNVKKINNNHKYINNSRGKLNIYFHRTDEASIQTYDDTDPKRLINEIFPKKVKEYFFFDGEKLEQYFKAAGSKNIKESIFRISQLDLLESVVKNLNLVIKDYRKSSVNETPEAQSINTSLEDAENDINRFSRKIDKTKDIIQKLEKFRDQYQEDIKNYGGKQAKDLLEENKEIDKILPFKIEKLNEKVKEKRILIMSSSFLIKGYDILKDSIKEFKKAEEQGLIPPSIDPEYIEKLSNKGKCICGTDISQKESSSRKVLNKFLKSLYDEIGEKPKRLIEIKNDIENIFQNYFNSLSSESKSLNEAIKMLSSDVKSLTKKKDTNLQSLRSEAKIKNFESKEDRLTKLNYQIKIEAGNLGRHRKDKEEAELEKKKLEKKYKDILSTNSRNEYLLRCINLCEEAKDQAEKIKNKIMSEIRKDISDKTAKYFKKFHVKKGQDLQVKIDDNYRIIALERGKELFDVFSKGEGALMAMSFIFALHHASGFNVPIFLDTALGRIDEKPKANWGTCISEYLNDTQIFLLFTSSEYSADVKDSLDDYVANHYIITSKKDPWDEAAFEGGEII